MLLCFSWHWELRCRFTVLYYTMRVCSVSAGNPRRTRFVKQLTHRGTYTHTNTCSSQVPTNVPLVSASLNVGSHQSIVPVLLGFYYSRKCPNCEIKVAFSCVAVVIARYVVTGSVKYPQEIKVQKIYTGRRIPLGRLSFCLSEVIADLYHPEGIIKSGLAVPAESGTAERRVPQLGAVSASSAPFGASTVTAVPHNARVLCPSARFLTSPLWVCIVSGSQAA